MSATGVGECHSPCSPLPAKRSQQRLLAQLVEGFFSKLVRSVLRHIRGAPKQELEDRIMAAMHDINRHPVVYTWSCKLDKAA
jgi:hypothetical protein